jgi:hypothetical protein
MRGLFNTIEDVWSGMSPLDKVALTSSTVIPLPPQSEP